MMESGERPANTGLEEILSYYSEGGEASRLQRGLGQLEQTRSRELLARYLPPPPAVIYDVGGGTGAYAFWLAEQGYQVHLLELSFHNVALARQAATPPATPSLAAVEVVDARWLPRRDSSAAVVLLMGPLYHLPEEASRQQALREAWRVLQPGGLLCAAAITRFASLLYGLSTLGLTNELLDEPEFLAMVRRELADGEHIRPPGLPGLFTRAFFHLPEQLSGEIAAAGFSAHEILAVEGVGWLLPNFEQHWEIPARQARLLELVRETEREPSLMGSSPHWLAMAHKPG